MRRLLSLVSALTTLLLTCGLVLQPRAGWAAFNPGSVDIFVDTTLIDPTSATYDANLAGDLQRLAQDMQNDGWTVIHHQYAFDGGPTQTLSYLPVPRDPGINVAGVPVDNGASVRKLKEQIYSDYGSSGNTLKAILLVGHVSQPYTGNYIELNHSGAYPCDGYYGDISDPDTNPADPNYPDTNWTDNSVNDTQSEYAANYNVPGDGKFDQTTYPDNVTLEVGRIDFDNMTGLITGPTVTEGTLLEQYLNKDHAFRMGYTHILPQARSYYSYGPSANPSGLENLVQPPGDVNTVYNEWFNPNSLTGEDMIANDPIVNPNNNFFYEDLTSANGFLNGTYEATAAYAGTWYSEGYPAGNATAILVDDRGTVSTSVTTNLFGTNDPHSVFYMLQGVDVEDYQFPNDVLRAAIGTPTYGLASVYSDGNLVWDNLSTLEQGGEIGSGVAACQVAGRNTYYNLMGDPTLRLFYDMEPSGVTAAKDPVNGVDVTWSVAYDLDASSQLVGYDIYSASTASGPYTQIATDYNGTLNTVTNTMEYTDTTASSLATTYYMVKAVYSQMPAADVYANPANASTLTPIYTNLSEGVTTSYTPGASAPTVVITAPANLEQVNGSPYSGVPNNLTNGVPLTTDATNITISAIAAPSSGNQVQSVTFYENSVLLATVTSATGPWEATIPQLSAGIYNIYAVVTDSSGKQAISETVRLYVYNPYLTGSIYNAANNVAQNLNYPVINQYYWIYNDNGLSPGWFDNAGVLAGWTYLTGPSVSYTGGAMSYVDSYANNKSIAVTFTQVSISDLSVNTSGGVTTCYSANNPFVLSDVGGALDITAGAGLNLGTYTVTNVTPYGLATLSGNAGNGGPGTATLNGGTYDLMHSPMDTTQFASSELSLQIGNPSTQDPITVTVSVPMLGPSGPNSSQSATIPPCANAAQQNYHVFTFDLGDMPGKLNSSSVIQNNFDGIVVESTNSFDMDEIAIGAENQNDLNQQYLSQPDLAPTASLVNYYTNLAIPSGSQYWAQATGYELRVDAADTDSAIEEADFYAGAASTPPFAGFGQIIPPPVGQPYSLASYSFNWVPSSVGANYLSATVLDGFGNKASTLTVPVNVDNLYGYVTDQAGNPIPSAKITVSSDGNTVASLTPSTTAIAGADASTSVGYSDLAISNTNADIVSSATLPFKPTDVGAVLDITGGGINFNLGPYTIQSVDANGNATLNAAAGVEGATGGIANRITSGVIYSDLAISGATDEVTSSSKPFKFSDLNSTLLITGGTGFTAGTYTIESVSSAGVATLNAPVGVLNSTGGQGILARSGTANYDGAIAPGTYTVAASELPNYAAATVNVSLSDSQSVREDFILLPAATNLTAVGGVQEVTLSWTGSTAATSYNIYKGTTPGGESGTPIASIPSVSGQSSYTVPVTGLANGTTYYFKVAAVSPSGSGPMSNEASAETITSAPTNLQAVGGADVVTLTWTGAAGATSYNVYEGVSPGGESTTPVETGVTATSCTVSGLAGETTYYFYVKAVDPSGLSSKSNEAEALTLPATVDDLSATGGVNQVVLNWTAAAGASTYNVYMGTSPGAELSHAKVSGLAATTCTIVGLDSGTTYYFTVRSANPTGLGAASNEASAITISLPPTGLTATGGVTEATLHWSASIGAATYDVYAGTKPGDESTTPIATGVTSTSYTASNLASGTTYYFKVAAVNASGVGSTSAEASALTVPAAPANVKATAGQSSLTLSWTASTGATTYNVYEGNQPGGESANAIKSGLTGTTYTVSNLNVGENYYFTIAAVDATGLSPRSSEVVGVPLPAPPAAVTTLTAQSENEAVQLTWTGVSSATGYSVYYSTTSGVFPATPAGTVTGTGTTETYLVQGLTNTTEYYFVVQATNGGGASANSNQVSAIPEAPVSFTPGIHFFSVPYGYPGESIDQVFGLTDTNIAAWNPSEDSYAISPNAPADQLRVGGAYWADFPTSVSTAPGGVPANPSQNFTIPLVQGWNSVGDPFTVSVPLTSLMFTYPYQGQLTTGTFAQAQAQRAVSSTVWLYDQSAGPNGSYQPASSLEEGSGYWIYSSTATSLIVPHP